MVRYALRVLFFRYRAVTVIAALSIGLGLGVNTAVFGLLRSILYY
ncbi:MAG: hypothetical protein ACRD8O_04275 [Bryobacteraceae bacterium]